MLTLMNRLRSKISHTAALNNMKHVMGVPHTTQQIDITNDEDRARVACTRPDHVYWAAFI